MASMTDNIELPGVEMDLASVVGQKVLEDILSAFLGYLSTRTALYDSKGQSIVELTSCEYCQTLKGENGSPVCSEFYSSLTRETARGQAALERPCPGGCLMRTEPILFGGHMLGVLMLRLSAPPLELDALESIARTFSLPIEALVQKAQKAPELSESLVTAARAHLAQAARLIPDLYRSGLAERKARELAAIQAIVSTVSHARDATGLARRAMETILELMHLEIGGLALYDPHKNEMIATAIIGLPPELAIHFARIPIKEGSGIVAQVALTRQPILVTDLSNQSFTVGNSRQVIEQLQISSLLIMPLMVAGEFIGGIEVAARGDRRFTQEDLDLLSSVATPLGVGLRRLLLQEDLLKRNQELLALNSITASISRSLNLDTILHDALDNVMELILAGSGTLYLVDDREERLVLHAHRNAPDWYLKMAGTLPFGKGIAGRTSKDGGPPRVGSLGDLYARDSEIYRRIQESFGGTSDIPYITVPLLSKERVLGVMNLVFRGPREFHPEELNLLGSIGNQIGSAIENARLYESERRRRAQLAGLSEILRALSTEHDLGILLKMIASRAAEVMHAQATSLMLWDEEGQSLVIRASYGLSEKYVDSQRIPRERTLNLETLPDGRFAPILSPELADQHFGDKALVQRENLRSLLAVPLSGARTAGRKGGPSGVLNIYSKGEPREFRPEEVELATIFGDQAAVVLDNARLLSERERRIAQLGVLNQISQAISATLSLDQLLDLIYWQISRVMDTANFYIALYHPERNLLTFAYEVEDKNGVEPHSRGLANGLTEHILRTRKPLLLSRDIPAACRDLGVEPQGRIPRSYLGVPMILGENVVGVIAVQSYIREEAYGTDDQELLAIIAHQAAIAIENARLYEATSERAKELAILYDIGRNLTQNLELDTLLDHILGAMQESFGYLNCAILLLDKEKNELFIKTARGYPEGIIGRRLKVGEEGITGWVASHCEPLNVPDVRENGRYVQGVTSARSELAVPLRIGNELLGVLDAESKELNAFDDKDIRMLSSFAAQAAIAIENAQLYKNLEERVKELDLLTLMTSRINAGLSLQETLETLVDEIRKVISYDTALLYFVTPDGTRLHPQIVRAVSPEYPQAYLEKLRTLPIPLGKGLAGWTAQKSEPVLCPNVVKDPRRLDLADTPPELSVVTIPLLVEKQTIGVLALSKLGERCFSPGDLRLLTVLADDAAIAIHKARLFDETQRLAILDGLTGLFNSRHFYNELKKEMERTERYAKPLSLILFDIDDFKKVNDSLGHQMGDSLLRELAQILPGLTRKTDLIARYGGEEFAILLPETSREHALATAERIRAKVETHVFPNAPELPRGRMTISVGVSTFPLDASNLRDFVRAADIALYAAKRAGKNRVFSYEVLSLKEGSKTGRAGGKLETDYEFRGSPPPEG